MSPRLWCPVLVNSHQCSWNRVLPPDTKAHWASSWLPVIARPIEECVHVWNFSVHAPSFSVIDGRKTKCLWTHLDRSTINHSSERVTRQWQPYFENDSSVLLCTVGHGIKYWIFRAMMALCMVMEP